MDYSELKKKKIKELKALFSEEDEKKGKLLCDLRKGKQTKKVHMVKKHKRNKARILTAVNYRKRKISERKEDLKR